jgi:hypothetical protein
MLYLAMRSRMMRPPSNAMSPSRRPAAAYAAFDHVDVAAVAVDDLATVAAGCAKANPGGLQDGNLEAVFQQEQAVDRPV